MIRNFFVGLVSMVLGHLLIFAGEAATWTLFPPPPGFDFSDPEKVKAMVAAMPLGAFVGIELGYLLGSAVAGLLIGRFTRGGPLFTATVVGTLFTLANLMNLLDIPSPLGFAVLTTVTFLPVTIGGAILGRPAS